MTATSTHTTSRNSTPSLNVRYRDTGCTLAPSCLRCPFVVCRYDRELTANAARTHERDEARARTDEACRIALSTPHPTLAAVSDRLGMAEPSVRRLLRLAESRGVPGSVAAAARAAVGMRSGGAGERHG